ncbi:MAG TPA: hypothetical protein VJO32_02365, partial [Ktedonobacteraceae bacterium]|nr:hypothetical protein [Ktedonobacteraceae bacterium]
MSVDKWFLTTVRVGDIVVYKMQPKDLPVNPDKEWRGKILRIYLDEPRLLDFLFVESLEEGETGMTEIVYLSQIVRKEK